MKTCPLIHRDIYTGANTEGVNSDTERRMKILANLFIDKLLEKLNKQDIIPEIGEENTNE